MTEEQRERRRTYQREYARKYRASRLEQLAKEARERRAANPEKYRAFEERRAEHNRSRSSLWRAKHPIRTAIQNYRLSARNRNLDNLLTDEQIADHITDNCFYCGSAPNPLNGIDRVDSQDGYVETNVVTACRACNIAKSNQPIAVFAAWVGRIGSKLPTWAEIAQ